MFFFDGRPYCINFRTIHFKNHKSRQIRSGEPTQIEYLPAEHTLDSEVQLLIEYKGRPTTTIAVGDEVSQNNIDLES